ncbi:MAG TPA: ATP synthase subunit I [Casimicrobiaceae bacterium]|nr:ATP synthase subunit I [Casimicrobiaceae bacterium]
MLKWQALATLLIAAGSYALAGTNGALSAILGGVVNLAACVVYAFVLGLSKPATAGATIVALFRAEASKLVVIIGALWLVLTTYKSVTLPAFFAAFLITVLLFRVALLVRD